MPCDAASYLLIYLPTMDCSRSSPPYRSAFPFQRPPDTRALENCPSVRPYKIHIHLYKAFSTLSQKSMYSRYSVLPLLRYRRIYSKRSPTRTDKTTPGKPNSHPEAKATGRRKASPIFSSHPHPILIRPSSHPHPILISTILQNLRYPPPRRRENQHIG